MSDPDFIDELQRLLVMPRRNAERALRRLKEGPVEGDLWTTSDYIEELLDQLGHLRETVAAEEARITCRCQACGHVHYVDGGQPDGC